MEFKIEWLSVKYKIKLNLSSFCLLPHQIHLLSEKPIWDHVLNLITQQNIWKTEQQQNRCLLWVQSSTTQVQVESTY